MAEDQLQGWLWSGRGVIAAGRAVTAVDTEKEAHPGKVLVQMQDFLKSWMLSKAGRGARMTPGFLAVGTEWLMGSLLGWGSLGTEVVGERKSKSVLDRLNLSLLLYVHMEVRSRHLDMSVEMKISLAA